MNAVAEDRSVRRVFLARMCTEVKKDLRSQREERERLTAALEREAAAIYRGEGDRGIRFAEAALRYLG